MDNTALLKQKILELESQLIAEHKAEEILSEMDTIDQIPEFFKFLFEKMPKSLGVPFVYHFVNIEKPYRREEDIRNL